MFLRMDNATSAPRLQLCPRAASNPEVGRRIPILKVFAAAVFLPHPINGSVAAAVRVERVNLRLVKRAIKLIRKICSNVEKSR